MWRKGREDALQFDMELREAMNDSRSKFQLPDGVYLCGNSLGPQPKRTSEMLGAHLQKWANLGARGHFEGVAPWVSIESLPADRSMQLVGARFSHEIAYMNSLTVNIHLLLTAMYEPKGNRRQILIDVSIFPSDEHALKTYLSAHDIDPDEALLRVTPRKGECTLREEDIIHMIQDNSETLALIFLPGVVYSTGQVLPMANLCAVAQEAGVRIGLDLAHAVGNIELHLHDWGADFAVWCTYKYLNSGPGAVAGVFLHDKYSQADLPRLGGWWGVPLESRFEMRGEFQAQRGARGLQISNVPVLATVPVVAALDVLKESGGVKRVREKSLLLTQFLANGIEEQLGSQVSIVTPASQRGCQLSLNVAAKSMRQVNTRLQEKGVTCDVREPNLLRVAICPLYNTYEDAVFFVEALGQVLEDLRHDNENS